MSKTSTGEFNIAILNLNRQALRRLREIRKRFDDSKRIIAFGVRALLQFRVDGITKETRFLFLRIRQRLIERNNNLSKNTESIIKGLNRFANPLILLVPPAGIGPAAHGLGIQCSIH
jgi:hypothetical protein